MKPNEIFYLILYSFKDLINGLIEVASMFKKARTWSFILYATIFLMVYYRKLTWVNFIIIISLILAIYIIRQSKEAEYHKSLKERAFKSDDKEKIMDYYEKYKKQCYYSRKEPLDYEEYKKDEIRKLDEKKYMED